MKSIKKDWIENLVIKYTREMIMKDNVIEDIAGIVFRNFQKENPAIQLLKQKLSETETALNNLLKAIEEGIITSTTKQRMLELEQTRDEINLKLIKEEMKKPKMTKEGLVLWLRQIQAMRLETKEHKQRLIDIFVNAVYLYDDKLVITFNYKEATKTVSLSEVNGSIIECAGVPKTRLPTGSLVFGTPEGTRKDDPPEGRGESVRWTLFSPWESPLICGRIRYGCGRKSKMIALAEPKGHKTTKSFLTKSVIISLEE